MEPASILELRDGSSQVIDVQTPFHKVLARDRDGSCHTLFVLAKEDIGQRQKAIPAAIEAMAKILKIDSNYIADPEGEISLLIGLENAELSKGLLEINLTKMY